MHDVIILGGGAAGFAAATYALHKQCDVLIIAENIGGKAGIQQQLRNHNDMDVERQLNQEIIQILSQRVMAFPDVILRDRVISITKVQGNFQVEMLHHGRQTSRTVLVATGANPMPLRVPGAHEFLHRGVGYSITTHSHILAGKRVAVVGNTPRALRGVIELVNMNTQVSLIVPNANGMTSPLARALRFIPQVTIYENTQVKEIMGTTNVEQIALTRDDETLVLPIDAVFIDLGLVPNSNLIRHMARVDSHGFIWIDDQHMTSLPGLFAAGDVTTAFTEQSLIAIGDGTRAAMNAYSYLLRHPVLSYQAIPSDMS